MGVSERMEDTLSIKFKRSDYLTWQQLCLLIEFLTGSFRVWFLTNAKVYFAKTSHHCVKYMWLSLRKIIFNSVKFYSWYCKIFRGLTFFWTQCRMVSLPEGEKISKISLFVLAQLRNVTDGRTDGWTPGDGNSRAMHSIARQKRNTRRCSYGIKPPRSSKQ